MEFRVTSKEPDYKIIHIDVNLDITSVHNLEARYLKEVYNSTLPVLIIDFEKVEYVSSAGVRILVLTYKFCQEKNIKFRLASLKPAVKKVFDIIDMGNMFPSYSSVKEAIR